MGQLAQTNLGTPASSISRAADALLEGNTAQARSMINQVLGKYPDHGEALHLAGLSEAQQGNTRAALVLLGRALAQQPNRVSWIRDLAALQVAEGKHLEALDTLSRAAALAPLDARNWRLRGAAYLKCGRCDEAVAAYEQALRMSPGCDKAFCGLGRAHSAAGNYQAAEAALMESLALNPEIARSHHALGDLYTEIGYHSLVVEHREAVLASRPDDTDARAWVARARFQVGNVGSALRAARELIDLGAASASFHSEYLGMLLHDTRQTPTSIRAAHEEWARIHCPPLTKQPVHQNSLDKRRKLRIGYLTGELIRGPAHHFLLPFLLHHDQSKFDIFLFHTNPKLDHCTEEYKSACTAWRDVGGWAEANITKLIRSEKIDILVDLSGHYDHHALGVFAQRPAPVQVTFPNYPATTGVSGIDYIFSDRWVCPDGLESQYTEKAYRLASGYLPYMPLPDAPPVSELPALKNGAVTFGLFQRPAKLNAEHWDAVAAILRRRANSRLLIHYGVSELDDPNSLARIRYCEELKARGIESGRIQFQGALAPRDHLSVLGQVDLALDTFPYNGQTTTCECLWMGVPVVTVIGGTHVARVGYELLDRCELGYLAARNVPEYVDIALTLSGDLRRLARLRTGLRRQMECSALLNWRRTAKEIERGYRWMWQRWRDGPIPAVNLNSAVSAPKVRMPPIAAKD